MKTLRILCLPLFAFAIACGGSKPASETPATETAAAAPAATAPDSAKVKEHLKSHIGKYPATKAELLAACAETPEFTASEKQWFSENLPEGSYASADDVVKALKL